MCACFRWRQEALRKIITTLAVKNEEIQSFIYSLKQMLLNVEVRKEPLQEGWKEVGKSWTGGWKGWREGAAMGASLLLLMPVGRGLATVSRPQFPYLSIGFGPPWPV